MTLTDHIAVRKFFTSEQWDMIYNFVGNALDIEDEISEDVYEIREKIDALEVFEND